MMANARRHRHPSHAPVLSEKVHNAPPAIALRGGAVHCAPDLIEAGDVHLLRQSTPPQSFDFPRQTAVGMHVAQTQRYIRAGVREGQRNGATQTARGARHKRQYTLLHAGANCGEHSRGGPRRENRRWEQRIRFTVRHLLDCQLLGLEQK